MASYPNLCQNLCDSFPLGNMPNLQCTIIIPNNPSCFMYPASVDTYLQEEVEHILCGPFQSSPLIIAIQTQASGTPDKLQICCHLLKGTKLHPSVNSFISKEDFPTHFDTAARVAEIVNTSYSSSSWVACTSINPNGVALVTL